MLLPLNMDSFCLSMNRQSELQILSAMHSSWIREVYTCMVLTAVSSEAASVLCATRLELTICAGPVLDLGVLRNVG